MMQDKKSILETLQQTCGCIFLSDVKMQAYHRQIYHALQILKADDFSLADWNEAVRYITQEDITFCTRQEARTYLLRKCK